MTSREKVDYLVKLAEDLLFQTKWSSSHINSLASEKSLFETGWRFQWNHSKKRIGLCCYRNKTIQLSLTYAANVADPEFLRNTLLHEIAHVLTPRHHQARRRK
jgi:hypothetical protein